MTEIKKAGAEEVRKAAKTAVIGTKQVLKNLKLGKISKAFITSNCPKDIKESIAYYAGQAEIFSVDVPNYELGVICKKPYPISVMAIIKGGKQ